MISGEDPLYMNDLDNLVKLKEQEMERYAHLMQGRPGFKQEGNLVFQGDMNAFGKNNIP